MSMLREGNQRLFRSTLASALLHVLLLQAIPTPEGPVTPPRARLRAHLMLGPAAHPAQESRISAPPPALRRLAAPAAPVAQPSKSRARREAKPQALPPPFQPELAQSFPVEQPLSAEQLGALRGLRISLALALGGEALRLAASCRALARMQYLPGGQLAALSLAESDCPEQIELWLISRLKRAIALSPVPAILLPSALEIELPLELEADRSGREEP